MKKIIFLSLLSLILPVQVSFAEGVQVLVFSKTAAFRHSSAINAGNTMFSNMATTNGWSIDFTENSADFTEQNLSQYDAIVWNNVSGNVLNSNQEQAFKSYINNGGGYVGIHNAADAETNWPWYVDLLGSATFLNHGGGSDQIQNVGIDLEGITDPITSHFQPYFTRTDEWYNFTANPRPFVEVLLSIDESTLSGPNMGGDHPITWKHEYDGGRVFYTGFGHTPESFSEINVITMLKEAVEWAANGRVILDEFNGATQPGPWVIQKPYSGSFPYTASINQLEMTGIEPGPNQHLVRDGIAIDATIPYTIETKFKILNSGGVKSFAINFLQDNQPASQNINTWSLNLDLLGPVIKYMGFKNGNFQQIGSRSAPWAVKNQEYIYKIEVNRRLNGDVAPKWVTATISKPDGNVMDSFEVDYSSFPWQPNLNEPVKFGLNSHFASWIASDLKVFYTGTSPNVEEEEPLLLGYWPLDAHADDFSGNDYHATEFNNPSYPFAHFNEGLRANGAYTSVNSAPFDSPKFTLMAWIKPDNISGTYRAIIEKDRYKSDWYGLYQVGNKVHLRWSSSGITTATSVVLEPNVFSHVAGTFDGSSAKIYINGVLVHSVSGSTSVPSTDDGELRFGITGSNTEPYQGIIDDVKVFGTPLNQDQVQLEMNSEIAPPVIVPVTGVSVSPDSTSLAIGETETLLATVLPSNATNQNVICTSDNESIATVNAAGVVTAVSAGTTTIRMTTEDGGFVDTASIQVSAPIVEGPIGYWAFDGNANDSSGNQNHAQEVNNPNYLTGYFNSGLKANGAYAKVNSDPFDTSAFTLMAWIKPDNVSGSYRVIMEKDRFKSDWYGLYQLGNKIHIRWSSTGTTTATSVSLEPNVFSHVTGTFNGSSAKIYINGVLKHTVSGSPSKPTTDDGELRFGITGSGTEAFQGIIDEAKIFGTALDQSDIQLEMNSSSSEGDPSNVPVTGVSIPVSSATLSVGDSGTLPFTILPVDATNTNVTFSSENPSIVSVSASGLVTAVSPGTTSVTVTTEDGGFFDTISLEVNALTGKQPVGYWKFDDNANDSSGNLHHGVEFNNPSYLTGYVNKGLKANGAYVSVNSDPFDTATFTLMAWIKPDNVSGSYRVIMEKDRFKSDWYGLYQVGDKLHVRWSSSGTTTATSISLQANVFTHVAGTFDGSSAKIYINGVLKHTVSGSPSTASSTDGELRFGITGSGTEAYQGVIDEAKIYDSALNQSEIQDAMNSSTNVAVFTPSEVSDSLLVMPTILWYLDV